MTLAFLVFPVLGSDTTVVRADLKDDIGEAQQLPTLEQALDIMLRQSSTTSRIVLRPGIYKPFVIPADLCTLSGSLCIEAYIPGTAVEYAMLLCCDSIGTRAHLAHARLALVVDRLSTD